MAIIKVDKRDFVAIKHWIQLLLSVIYFVYMWFISDPSDWVTQREYKIKEWRNLKGEITDKPDDKSDIYYANQWTTYNILRGSSLAFLLGTGAGAIVDLLDYHDKIIHIKSKDDPVTQ